jgi:hypothetical protein
MWYSNLNKTFISRHILQQQWYTCPIALPLRRNPQHRSVLSVLFQPLRHQRNVCHPVVNRFTRQTLPIVNSKHFFMNILCVGSFCPQKTAQQNSALRQYTPQAWSPYRLLKPAFEHEHARLLARLSWSWTVLLPSDKPRKPSMSITAVLLPFVAYSVTSPRTLFSYFEVCPVKY